MIYVIREVFTAKPGQAGKLAKLFKKGFASPMKARVLTDVVGNYNTVIMEVEMTSLADWEKSMAEHKAGRQDPKLDPKVAEEMAKYTEMYQRGRREIFQVVED
jgi:hypothetical protein